DRGDAGVTGGAEVGGAERGRVASGRPQADDEHGTGEVRLQGSEPLHKATEVRGVLVEASETGRQAYDSGLHVGVEIGQVMQATNQGGAAGDGADPGGVVDPHKVVGQLADHLREQALAVPQLAAVTLALHRPGRGREWPGELIEPTRRSVPDDSRSRGERGPTLAHVVLEDLVQPASEKKRVGQVRAR